jgi:hypothetical protein
MANQPAWQGNVRTNLSERKYERLSPKEKKNVREEVYRLLTDHRTAPRQLTMEKKDRQAPKN